MKLLIYANGKTATRERLSIAIEGQVQNHSIEICETVDSLSARLRQRTGDLAIVILCISSPEELKEILLLRAWLQDLRIIVLLPDRNSNTLSEGLTLRPRFVGYADTDFTDVSAVLARMSRIYGDESNWS